MEPNAEPEFDIEDEGITENPNLVVTLELLDSGDVNVSINREASTLGDILAAVEVGKINILRQYFEHLDKVERGEV